MDLKSKNIKIFNTKETVPANTERLELFKFEQDGLTLGIYWGSVELNIEVTDRTGKLLETENHPRLYSARDYQTGEYTALQDLQAVTQKVAQRYWDRVVLPEVLLSVVSVLLKKWFELPEGSFPDMPNSRQIYGTGVTGIREYGFLTPNEIYFELSLPETEHLTTRLVLEGQRFTQESFKELIAEYLKCSKLPGELNEIRRRALACIFHQL